MFWGSDDLMFLKNMFIVSPSNRVQCMQIFAIFFLYFIQISPIIIDFLFQSHYLSQIKSLFSKFYIPHLQIQLFLKIILKTYFIVSNLKYDFQQTIKILFSKNIYLLNSIRNTLHTIFGQNIYEFLMKYIKEFAF